MTKSEIIEVLNIALDMLQTNKKYVTPELLKKINDFVDYYGYDPRVRTILTGTFGVSNDEIDEYLEVAFKVIKTEKNLVNVLTPKLISGINNLKNRPVVLSLLAGLI